MKKILITGGSGLLGSSFKRRLKGAAYPTSKELDLLDPEAVSSYILEMQPDLVIHLAGKVGGVKNNTENMYSFYHENATINNNVIDACVKSRVKRLVCCLSTCIYPDEKFIKYPLTEDQLHLGPPHNSNFGYAYAKRMVDIQLRAVRQQYGLEYISVIPNNIYGENDNFHLEDGHVIPALIRKIWEAKINNRPTFDVWGDGQIFREFTYVDDIRDAILFVNENYNEASPINIGSSKEYSLKFIIETICEIFDYSGEIVYDATKPKGQVRKPSSNKKLLELGWRETDYESIKLGLERTCNWFTKNYPNIRGVDAK